MKKGINLSISIEKGMVSGLVLNTFYYSDKSCIPMSNSTGYSPKSGDKLYFLKGCTVPRVKAREYCSKRRLSITIKKENANVMFSPKNMENQGYKGIIKRKDILSLPLGPSIKKELSALEWDGASGWWWQVQRDLPNFPSSDSCYEYKEDCTEIKNNNKIYCEEEIISLIGSDKEVLDFDSFINLRKMLDSSDGGSRALAMDMLCNCNYEKSLIYLLPLYNSIRSSYDTPNTVLFKGLRKWCDDVPYDGCESLIEIMKDRERLTLNTVNLIIEVLRKELLSSLDLDHFSVDLCPSPELLSGLDVGKEEEKVLEEETLTFL